MISTILSCSCNQNLSCSCNHCNQNLSCSCNQNLLVGMNNNSSFQQRKLSALAAITCPTPDKSPKGNIDEPIIPLLNLINSHPSYFTTSSCSGRISILSTPNHNPTIHKKARGGTWLLVSHSPISPSSLLQLLFDNNDSSNRSNLVFRFEPLIIAVECDGVEKGKELVGIAVRSGFRESGITSLGKRVIVGIRCSIRLEVPLGDGDGNVLVGREYVHFLVGIANDKMETNRRRTDGFFEKLVECGFGDGLDGDFVEGSLVGNGVDSVADSGSPEEVSGINLSVLKIAGEPVESLFLWGHSACTLDRKRVLIFGGFGGIGRHARRNNLLLLDKESEVVEKIDAVGSPSPRLGHTSSLVGDCMYVIGGRADPLNILNEVWVFNIPRKEWKLQQCSGTFFPPRHRHTAAVVGSKIYVFGGIHNDSILSSLYVLDTNTTEWTEIGIKGDKPGPRHSHSMEANESKIYIFGGYNGERVFSDLYIFNTETGSCNKLKTKGQSPTARFSQTMFVYSNFLGILGGCPVSEHGKLFILDLQTESWSNVTIKSIEEGLFVRSTGNVVGDDLLIVGGGAACYAFGTKFSEPMKIDLLQLTSLCHNTANGESKVYLHSNQDSEQKVNGFVDQVPELDASKLNNGRLGVHAPSVLKLDKKYAKLGKDILKHFGWLDPERKVYTRDMSVCFPITGKFCTLFEDKQHLVNEFEDQYDLQSLTPSCWQMILKGNSHSAALDILVACGASKIVDEVIKVKKNPITPFEVLKEAIGSLLKQHGLTLDLLDQLPTRWERLGDIIVLPTMSLVDPVWDSIGEHVWPVVAQSFGTQRLARQGRIAQSGTRDSKLEMLVGEDGWVNHRENGVLYSFDATKCMFSWGNLSEKLRVGHFECRDQVVVDLFAGIGYFTLPLLVRANAKMVYACEWNPHAIEALRRNLDANNVADRCVVLEGDNRVTAPKGVADRVSLGLLPSSECSYLTAVRALRDEGGILHIHGNAKDTEEDTWVNHVAHSISEIAKSEGRSWEVSVEHVERVKWYAPHIRHLVIDMRCKVSNN